MEVMTRRNFQKSLILIKLRTLGSIGLDCYSDGTRNRRLQEFSMNK